MRAASDRFSAREVGPDAQTRPTALAGCRPRGVELLEEETTSARWTARQEVPEGGPLRLALPGVVTTSFQRRSHVEVKIGIKDTPRELVVSSGQTPEEVEKLVAEALTAGDGLFRLDDEKGRLVALASILAIDFLDRIRA